MRIPVLAIAALLLMPGAYAFGQDIFDAVRAGQLDRVVDLLAEGADVDQEGPVDGYQYSDAMKQFGGVWNGDRLYGFLIHPMMTVPGTRMYALTTDDPQVLADIVAYLRDRKQ